MSLEFCGGLELLFDGMKKWQGEITPKDGKTLMFQELLDYVHHNLLKERPELFVAEGSGVRTGILVLINDVDWELEGKLDYEVQDGDEISFISTLHGG